MSEKERDLIRRALQESGSLENLIRDLARSESEEMRRRRLQIESGPDHPSDEQLYDYVLGWLSREDERYVLDHISMCRVCLEDVIRIRGLEEPVPVRTAQWTEQKTWAERTKDFLSADPLNVSYGSSSHPPIGSRDGLGEPPSCKRGDQLLLKVEAPEDGQVVVFHYCEETGEAEMVFPRLPEDNPNVAEGQELRLGQLVSGPPGRHGLKVIWTSEELFGDEAPAPTTPADRKRQTEAVLNAIEELEDDEWRGFSIEFEVAPKESGLLNRLFARLRYEPSRPFVPQAAVISILIALSVGSTWLVTKSFADSELARTERRYETQMERIRNIKIDQVQVVTTGIFLGALLAAVETPAGRPPQFARDSLQMEMVRRAVAGVISRMKKSQGTEGSEVMVRSLLGLLDPGLITGDLETLKLLGNSHVDLNSRLFENGRTLLHSAARPGQPEACEYLLRKGVQVDVLDEQGRTPLSLASEGGHEDTVKLLLAYGANPEIKDKHDKTALDWASFNGHDEVKRILSDKLSG